MAVYVITGKLVNGKRFKPIKTLSQVHAMNINLYHGSVWEETPEGKRVLIKRVTP